jgi:hypothetical protein
MNYSSSNIIENNFSNFYIIADPADNHPVGNPKRKV